MATHDDGAPALVLMCVRGADWAIAARRWQQCRGEESPGSSGQGAR
jgi:hypothetical protein